MQTFRMKYLLGAGEKNKTKQGKGIASYVSEGNVKEDLYPFES